MVQILEPGSEDPMGTRHIVQSYASHAGFVTLHVDQPAIPVVSVNLDTLYHEQVKLLFEASSMPAFIESLQNCLVLLDNVKDSGD